MSKFFTFIGITALALSVNGACAFSFKTLAANSSALARTITAQSDSSPEVVYFTGLPINWANMQDMGLIPCTPDTSYTFPGTHTSSTIKCTFAQTIPGSAQVMQGSDPDADINYTLMPNTANQAFYFSSADIHDATGSFSIPSTPPSGLMTIHAFAFSILSDKLTMQLSITGTITTREIPSNQENFTIIYQYNPTTNFSVNTCIAQPNNQAKCCSASASSSCNT
ncbi:MAG: hypothetical protein A3C55_03515 [Gammaproteobacteria bacterium RIFCSPHIGHO2_02_FULL_42_13]|nr:MAG: hypothetical protein A3C55_03515 [Gammaproteobacteria bacterium RIFCSPHIGHO2_02_FULL_42_13]